MVGNTDQQGDETRNFVVSQRRADAVVDYLVAEGDRPARLTTQPAGAIEPAAHRWTPEADASTVVPTSCSSACSELT